MRNAALVAFSALLFGCASAPPAKEGAPSTAAAAPSSALASEAPPSPDAANGVAPAPASPPADAPAPPLAEPVLAADSNPPGVSPLDKDEREEARTACKPLTEAIGKAARKDLGSKTKLAYAEEALRDPPAIAGVDVPRCAKLFIRDLRAYEARTVEAEAIMNLKRIAVGMASALDRSPSVFCASAAPVPAALPPLAKEPFVSSPSDWTAPGWSCVGFDHPTPQRFQYELRTDPKAQTFEAIARGFPVPGERAVTLSLSLRVENGSLTLSSDVMRR